MVDIRELGINTEIEVRCSCGKWHFIPLDDYYPEAEPYDCELCYHKKGEHNYFRYGMGEMSGLGY